MHYHNKGLFALVEVDPHCIQSCGFTGVNNGVPNPHYTNMTQLLVLGYNNHT